MIPAIDETLVTTKIPLPVAEALLSFVRATNQRIQELERRIQKLESA